MGMSTMLGIVDAIGNVFSNLFSWLVSTLLVPVIQGAITAVVWVVKYVFAGVFYQVSVFLLQLIDFVQVLFRALAGLDNFEGNHIFFSLEGGSGDLLLQMLRSRAVLDAFYACCIVGMFLLIITTIFQMIKVEYTSEGAQNSKTGIIGKSLKSLSNLILLPALVIFGVFIGNQVLDLIDTATGVGDSNKISGVMFVTAASDAMWNDFENVGEDYIVKDRKNLLGMGIGKGIKVGMDPENNNEGEYGTPLAAQREKIEAEFMKCSKNYSYAFTWDVTRYYNIFEINYFVLILGSCIIIKCLFFTCFGMVDRLYQCIALFIISPMVIGMTPVKDSLASWRSKFIGKALSAYGIVISLNLFFTIIGLFLNIDIKINNNISESALILLPSFMEGLIKSIFVIVGCGMIEKLAGDMGTYFGASNAAAEGKGIAAEAGKGLVKAGAAVGGLAFGGAALAGKMAGGIASRVKTAHNLGGSRGDKLKAFIAPKTMTKKAAKEKLGSAEKSVADAGDKFGNIVNQGNFSREDYDKYKAFENDKNALDEEYNDKIKKQQEIVSNPLSTQAERVKAGDKITDLEKEKTTKIDKIKEKQSKLDQKFGSESKYQDVINAENDYKSAVEGKNKAQGVLNDFDKSKDDKRLDRRARFMTAAGGLRQLGSDALQTLVPGPLKNAQKKWDDAVNKGNIGDEGEAAKERVANAKKKKKVESYNKNVFINHFEKANREEQNQIIQKAIIEKAEFKQNEANSQMRALIDEFKGINDKLKDPKLNESERKSLENDAEYVKNQMRALNPKVKFEGDTVLNATMNLDFSSFKKDMEEALKKNSNTQELNAILAKHLKKWGEEGNQEIIKELRKVVEELKGEVGK